MSSAYTTWADSHASSHCSFVGNRQAVIYLKVKEVFDEPGANQPCNKNAEQECH
jgi:hypothetical protein